MEWLDTDVVYMQSALQETPEILQRIRVNVAIYECYRLADNGVPIVGLQTIIGFQLVAEESRARFDSFARERLRSLLGTGVNMPGDNFTAALDHSEHDFLSIRAASGDLFRPDGCMRVMGIPANECFIHLDFAIEWIKALILHGKTNPAEHEPSGLLDHLQTSMNLVRADAVIAGDKKPCGTQPLFESDRAPLRR